VDLARGPPLTCSCTFLLRVQSCVDTSFWSELGHRKLNDYKLSEDAVSITGKCPVQCHSTPTP
jgi:hypothetical protein